MDARGCRKLTAVFVCAGQAFSAVTLIEGRVAVESAATQVGRGAAAGAGAVPPPAEVLAPGQRIIDRPQARALTVSGLYHAGDSAGFAASVAKMYGLQVVERDGRPREPAENDAAPDPASSATTMDAMVVTGTRIRGGSTPSPVITIGAKRIQEEGFRDLGDVIRSVPQNFGGGQNPGVVAAVGSGNTYNQNVTGGTSLNLRGAGADATLTLLNGRRRSYGGLYDSVDISAIPVEAVERIEIVADGASAIYGSDAIAGVGNVILRRDFEGVLLGTRYGTSADGGLTTREYSGTTGAVWDGGG